MLYPLILPVTIGLILAALHLDDALHPPLWVHALIWAPLAAVAITGTLRLAKMALLMHRIAKSRH